MRSRRMSTTVPAILKMVALRRRKDRTYPKADIGSGER
jgi:hypothetical protein